MNGHTSCYFAEHMVPSVRRFYHCMHSPLNFIAHDDLVYDHMKLNRCLFTPFNGLHFMVSSTYLNSPFRCSQIFDLYTGVFIGAQSPFSDDKNTSFCNLSTFVSLSSVNLASSVWWTYNEKLPSTHRIFGSCHGSRWRCFSIGSVKGYHMEMHRGRKWEEKCCYDSRNGSGKRILSGSRRSWEVLYDPRHPQIQMNGIWPYIKNKTCIYVFKLMQSLCLTSKLDMTMFSDVKNV